MDSGRRQRGLLFIVSAPSGTGKTTLVERLVQMTPHLRMSRSYTSRPAREGERDGVDYNFITRERFEAMIREGAFLEYAVIYDNYYGTAAADCERDLAAGEDVVLVIDVQGARQVRARALENIGIFVLPPSAAVLEQRLRGRSKDTVEQIQRRLEVACREVSDYAAYDYVIINDDVDACVERLHAVVLAERARVERMRASAEDIIGTFRKEETVGKNAKRESV
ncbi:MAG TPA: guanylate kinase [Vicinamibacterales bacterium]|nr:guanylate kinase [Vicinamibacterales bacterium]